MRDEILDDGARHGAPWWTFAMVLAIGLVLLLPYRNFTTDDAFIHYRFARNLASGSGFAFNPGEPTYGDTSPAWVLLLATTGDRLRASGVAPDAMGTVDEALARGGVVHGADAWRLASKLLDLAALVVAFLLFARLARRRVRGPAWGAPVVALLFFVDPWLVKWGLAGMEAPLAVALALGALVLRDRARNSGGVDAGTPLVLGIACLVRPESCLLGVALVIDIVLCERRRRTSDLVLAVVVPAVVLAPWLIYAWQTFGVVVPNTMPARRDVNYSFVYLATKMAKILGSTYLIAGAGVLLAVVRVARSRRGDDLADAAADARRTACERLAFPLIAVVLVLAFYLGWRVSVGARYLLLITPYIVLIGYGAIVELVGGKLRAAMLAMAFVVLVVVQWGAVRFVTRWPLGLDTRLFEIAELLRDGTPARTVVAAHEIGVIGHVGDRRVVDLAALVSPDLVPFGRTGSVAESLGDRRVELLVWNSNTSPDSVLAADMVGRLEPLLVRQVHREGSSHLGGWQYYTVYRVDGAGEPR